MSLLLCAEALGLTVSLRTGPDAGVVSVAAAPEHLAGVLVQRTGPQELTVSTPAAAALPGPAQRRGGLVSDMVPQPGGFRILLRSRAFGYVAMPVAGDRVEVHVFDDAVGARWVKPKAAQGRGHARQTFSAAAVRVETPVVPSAPAAPALDAPALTASALAGRPSRAAPRGGSALVEGSPLSGLYAPLSWERPVEPVVLSAPPAPRPAAPPPVGRVAAAPVPEPLPAPAAPVSAPVSAREQEPVAELAPTLAQVPPPAAPEAPNAAPELAMQAAVPTPPVLASPVVQPSPVAPAPVLAMSQPPAPAPAALSAPGLVSVPASLPAPILAPAVAPVLARAESPAPSAPAAALETPAAPVSAPVSAREQEPVAELAPTLAQVPPPAAPEAPNAAPELAVQAAAPTPPVLASPVVQPSPAVPAPVLAMSQPPAPAPAAPLVVGPTLPAAPEAPAASMSHRALVEAPALAQSPPPIESLPLALPAPQESVYVSSPFTPPAEAGVLAQVVAPSADGHKERFLPPLASLNTWTLPASSQTPGIEEKPLRIPSAAAPRIMERPGQYEAPADAGEGQTLTLRQALDEALKTNRRMLATKSRADSADHNVSIARSALFPRAQLSAGVNRVVNPNNNSESNSDYVDQQTKTYTLSLQQNIFDGLVRLNSVARAKLVKVRAEEEVRKSELDTIEAVQREYFRLIRIRADMTAYKASIDRLRNQLESAEAFFRLEMAPRLTVLQVETALAQAEQRLSRATSDERIQLVKLSALLGKPAGARLDFAGDLRGFDYGVRLQLDDCVSRANMRLPEAVIAEKDVQIAQQEFAIAKGKMFPRLDLAGSYIKSSTDYRQETSKDADRKYYTAGVNLTWDVFSGGETAYEIKSREKMLQATQDELAGIRLNVYAYVRETYLNYLEGQNQMRIALVRSREASEAYGQASMRFRSGIGTSMDLLDAQEKVTAGESAYNQAQAEYLTALASLYRAMGEKEETLANLTVAEYKQ